MNERGSQIEPALHAAGVALDAPICRLGELDEFEQLLSTGGRRRGGTTEQAALEREQLAARLACIESGFLQGHADLAAHSVRILADIDARHLRSTGGDGHQGREHAHGIGDAVLDERCYEVEPLAARIVRPHGPPERSDREH